MAGRFASTPTAYIHHGVTMWLKVEVFEGEESYWLRTEFSGCASKVFRALGIGAPPTVRRA